MASILTQTLTRNIEDYRISNDTARKHKLYTGTTLEGAEGALAPRNLGLQKREQKEK